MVQASCLLIIRAGCPSHKSSSRKFPIQLKICLNTIVVTTQLNFKVRSLSDNSLEASPVQDSFAISFAPLSIEEIYKLADTTANGAVVLMSGMVRNQTDGKPVVSLEYQAYEPMAKQVFNQIARDIRQQWPDVTRVVIHLRIGHLQVG